MTSAEFHAHTEIKEVDVVEGAVVRSAAKHDERGAVLGKRVAEARGRLRPVLVQSIPQRGCRVVAPVKDGVQSVVGHLSAPL
jgi:hypothetical protein